MGWAWLGRPYDLRRLTWCRVELGKRCQWNSRSRFHLEQFAQNGPDGSDVWNAVVLLPRCRSMGSGEGHLGLSFLRGWLCTRSSASGIVGRLPVLCFGAHAGSDEGSQFMLRWPRGLRYVERIWPEESVQLRHWCELEPQAWCEISQLALSAHQCGFPESRGSLDLLWFGGDITIWLCIRLWLAVNVDHDDDCEWPWGRVLPGIFGQFACKDCPLQIWRDEYGNYFRCCTSSVGV